MFDCHCLITIQTQNFIAYFGHVTMYTCNYVFFIIKFRLIFLIKKLMINKMYDLIFS
jgi:hypothetical protein